MIFSRGRLVSSILAFAACGSTPEPAPGAPDPAAETPAGPSEPANLLADPEMRKLYLDLDQYTQRWMSVQGQGNTEAAAALERTVIRPLVDKHLDELLTRVGQPDNRPRQITAARSLGFGSNVARIGPALMQQVGMQDANLVTSVLVSLWLLESPDTPLGPLVDRLLSPDEDIRNNAAMALSAILRAKRQGERGPPSDEVKRVAGKLVYLVSDEDEDPFVRAHAASALGAIGDPAATDILVNLLADRASVVRIRAAEGLGQLGQAQALPPLIQALEVAETPTEKTVVAASMERIARVVGYPVSAEALGFDAANWREWYLAVRR